LGTYPNHQKIATYGVSDIVSKLINGKQLLTYVTLLYLVK